MVYFLQHRTCPSCALAATDGSRSTMRSLLQASAFQGSPMRSPCSWACRPSMRRRQRAKAGLHPGPAVSPSTLLSRSIGVAPAARPYWTVCSHRPPSQLRARADQVRMAATRGQGSIFYWHPIWCRASRLMVAFISQARTLLAAALADCRLRDCLSSAVAAWSHRCRR